MSLDPVLYYAMPEDTARVAHAAFPKGSVYLRMHDALGPLYHNPSFSKKRYILWTGYKAHLTETCDPAAPHLITHVEMTLATTQDRDVTGTIHTALAAKALLPAEHLLGEGYSDAAHLITNREEHGVVLVDPVARDGSWQAVEGHGCDRPTSQWIGRRNRYGRIRCRGIIGPRPSPPFWRAWRRASATFAVVATERFIVGGPSWMTGASHSRRRW